MSPATAPPPGSSTAPPRAPPPPWGWPRTLHPHYSHEQMLAPLFLMPCLSLL